jgi:hypothetical protein
MRGSNLIGYESACLLASCWLFSTGDKLLAALMLGLSLVVWVSHYGAQFHESDDELKAGRSYKLHDREEP